MSTTSADSDRGPIEPVESLTLPVKVYVRWSDHYDMVVGEWTSLSELEEAKVCFVESVAYLVRVNKDTLTICQSITDEEDGRNVFVILRSNVFELRTL